MNSSVNYSATAPERHLVFVNYYFPPMGGGGVQRVVKFLKFFDYRAYRISVLTVKPSYFYSRDDSLLEEVPHQAEIVRSGSADPFRLIYLWKRLRGKRDNPSSSSKESSGIIRKIAMSIFIPDSRAPWLPFALYRLWRLHRRRPVDVLFCSMPPFTAGLIGYWAKKLLGIPFVLDFRDAWTGNPYLPQVSRWHQRRQERLERRTLRAAAGIVFVNPALQAHYLSRFPEIERIPHRTIRNGYDPDDFPATLPGSAAPGARFQMVILGTIYSQGNRPLTFLEALGQLRAEQPDLPDRFQLRLIGKWSPDFREQANQMGVEDLLEYTPYLPHREALQEAARANALMLAIESNLPGSRWVTPGRIYEYLYLRRPILAVCPPDSDLAFLVRRCQAGEVIEYRDVGQIKSVLKQWLAAPEELPARYPFHHLGEFSRTGQTASLIEWLNQCRPFTSLTG